ncbi:conserved hypothetical protein [Hyphomicrobiales bacterium]|nr:conserved hypothetical protein [Hyphomicrobiales bacterium]
MARKKSEKTDVITSIKGFDSNLRCRGYQFEIGKTYSAEGNIKACENGFHACPVEEHPLSVFDYYPPSGARYCEVEQSGESDRDGVKLASASITIKAEISISDLIARAIKYVFDRAKPEEGASATGYRGAASATGDQGAASATGDQGAASATGYRGAASATGSWGAASATGSWGAASATGSWGAASATGSWGAASATGSWGAASATGYRGAASATGSWGAASATGDQGAASATGYRGAASATGSWGAASATGSWGAASATGSWGAASATGSWGAASATGYRGAASATGDQGAAMAAGYEGRVSGAKGSALFLVERNDDYEIINVWAGIAGQDGINENTFYTLKGGKPVEVE